MDPGSPKNYTKPKAESVEDWLKMQSDEDKKKRTPKAKTAKARYETCRDNVTNGIKRLFAKNKKLQGMSLEDVKQGPRNKLAVSPPQEQEQEQDPGMEDDSHSDEHESEPEQDNEDESDPEQDDKLNNGCMVESEEDPDPDLLTSLG